jgi:small subunit ribosomal protein S20
MPILKNAQKALRVSKRKSVANARIRSRVKTMSAAVVKTPTAETLAHAYSSIDKAVKKNIIRKNKAARLKSQLSKRVPSAKKRVSSTKKSK